MKIKDLILNSCFKWISYEETSDFKTGFNLYIYIYIYVYFEKKEINLIKSFFLNLEKCNIEREDPIREIETSFFFWETS